MNRIAQLSDLIDLLVDEFVERHLHEPSANSPMSQPARAEDAQTDLISPPAGNP